MTLYCFPSVYLKHLKYCKLFCRFIDLDTPLLLSEDPVLEGYEGILCNMQMLLLYLSFSCKEWFDWCLLQSDDIYLNSFRCHL